MPGINTFASWSVSHRSYPCFVVSAVCSRVVPETVAGAFTWAGRLSQSVSYARKGLGTPGTPRAASWGPLGAIRRNMITDNSGPGMSNVKSQKNEQRAGFALRFSRVRSRVFRREPVRFIHGRSYGLRWSPHTSASRSPGPLEAERVAPCKHGLTSRYVSGMAGASDLNPR